MSLKAGDRVSCRIKSGAIISSYEDMYDETITFEIVAADFSGYFIYCPHYLILNGIEIANHSICKKLEIDLKFLNENIIHITSSQITNIQKMDGMVCKRCQEFHQYADVPYAGQLFTCFACRENPYR